MKTLLLMRHAKSSWDNDTLADHLRPLNRRGRAAATLIGRLIREHALLPDQILCSTSVRTRQTYDLLTEDWDNAVATKLLDELYHCPADGVPGILQHVTQDVGRVLLIGHNPGLSDFLAATVGFSETFPTAALAWLTVDLEQWSEFSARSPMQLRKIWRPRDLV